MNKNSIFDIIKKLGEVAKNVQTDSDRQSSTANQQPQPKNARPKASKGMVDKADKQAVKKNRAPSTDAIIKMINDHNRRAEKIKHK